MDEDLRGRFVIANDEFTIKSIEAPELNHNTLYIRGVGEQHDERVFAYQFVSEEEAITAAKNIQTLLQENSDSAQIKFIELEGAREIKTPMKLEVELFRYRTLLFGRVLHIDADLRGNLRAANNDFAIKSVACPVLMYDTLYVRGTDNECDEMAFACHFGSEEEVTAAAKNIQGLLQKINGSPQDDTPSLVEQVI